MWQNLLFHCQQFSHDSMISPRFLLLQSCAHLNCTYFVCDRCHLELVLIEEVDICRYIMSDVQGLIKMALYGCLKQLVWKIKINFFTTSSIPLQGVCDCSILFFLISCMTASNSLVFAKLLVSGLKYMLHAPPPFVCMKSSMK